MKYSRLFKAWWIFYQKLILPSLVTALLLAVFSLPTNKIVPGVALAYIPLSLFYQYIFYDYSRRGEYLFYYNLGLGKTALWLISLSAGCIFALSVFMLSYL
ncbi:hypothetical protein [Pedobacter montanisoli]|uniref:Uncharacterized protein n=1 Tax=Pedobacter montanisoli TaxID=2923277 RepID=A0ABS9ZWY8_9SPHI|nr:hypothetical protein [Pedobacter montanisoli]MCJ0742819.1 hypothetical protein [Pedobacter montanisoli]